ncbi:MAG: spore germination protein [Lachnospiraceae bacterium]
MLISRDIKVTMKVLQERLGIGYSFDIIHREICVGGKKACMYFIDGFCKDEIMQKMIEYFMGIRTEDLPTSVDVFCRSMAPYIEIDMKSDYEDLVSQILSGVFILVIDGYEKALLIDARTYPARSVEEPSKDRALRGSRDGFVETIVFNTALIRRRIRDESLRMEMYNVGESSKTDVVVCYMDQRANPAFLETIKYKIQHIKVDSLILSCESMAEALYKRKWYNPFPKFKYTQRPDTAAAQLLEGNIIILIDTAPTAIVLPTTIFDILEETDDYCFPPLTGSYLKLSRLLILLLTYLIAPLFLLLMDNRTYIPEVFDFIQVQESVNIPLIWQFLILELAIDGLRLAAVNTPNILSTPLSIMAGLVLGEFSVQSGWFNAEVMLYMAFIAIASYTQPNYELGYALKFMRIINLILTAILGLWGFMAGILICVVALGMNKTVSGTSYLYPLFPLDTKALKRQLFRCRLSNSEK